MSSCVRPHNGLAGVSLASSLSFSPLSGQKLAAGKAVGFAQPSEGREEAGVGWSGGSPCSGELRSTACTQLCCCGEFLDGSKSAVNSALRVSDPSLR